MTNLDFLRFWAVDAVMHCTDEELLDLVDKILLHCKRDDE